MIDDYLSVVIFALLLTISFLALTYKNYADASLLEFSITNSERRMYAESALASSMLSWDPLLNKELFLEVIEGNKRGTYQQWNVSGKINSHLSKYYSYYNYKVICDGEVVDSFNSTQNYTYVYSFNMPEGCSIVLEVQE